MVGAYNYTYISDKAFKYLKTIYYYCDNILMKYRL